MKKAQSAYIQAINTESATFYHLTYQKSKCVEDIDVYANATCVTFNKYDEVDSYNLKDVKKQYPNVTKLIIGEQVKVIEISNFMFPNVRDVESKSEFFLSGSMLINSDNMLLNSFCLREDEQIDLSNVTYICDYALEGCRSKDIVPLADAEIPQNIYFDENTFEGFRPLLAQEYENGICKFGNNIILDIEEGVDIVMPDNIHHVYRTATEKTIKKLTVKKISDIDNVYVANFKINTLNIDNDTINAASIKQRHYKGLLVNEYMISPDNAFLTTINGIVYTKDMKSLIACPIAKTGIIHIPNGVECIGESAFSGSLISGVIMSESIKKIEKEAFFDCLNLEKVVLSQAISVIPDSCFKYCLNIKDIEIPRQITHIERFAFYGSGVENVRLHDGIRIITNYAFFGCKNLLEITLPDSLCCVGLDNFEHVTMLHIGERLPCVDSLYAAIGFNIRPENRYGLYTKIVCADGNVYFIPKDISRNKLMEIARTLENTTKIESGWSFFKLCKGSYYRQMIAWEAYIETNNENIKKYLQRGCSTLIVCFIRKGDEENAIRALKIFTPTEKAMEYIRHAAEESKMTSLLAYILNKTKSQQKKSFNL